MLIKKIKRELNVNAKYCPQCIPKESFPDLSNSDFSKKLIILYRVYKVIYKFDMNAEFSLNFF